MGIIDFLKKEIGARLTYYRRWMIWDTDDNLWKVYKEVNRNSVGKLVIETTNEKEAIAKLIYD